jgi:hypothetical protein
MAFSFAALPFLVYAVAECGLLAFVAWRFYAGVVLHHRATWQIGRSLLICSLAGVIVDNIRHFAGGFWADLRQPPTFANVVYGLEAVHLVFVPLLLIVQVELGIAASAARLKQTDKAATTAAGLQVLVDPLVGTRHARDAVSCTLCHAVAGEPGWACRGRIVAAILAFAVAAAGAINCAARLAATAELGLVREERFGVAVFTPVNLTAAADMGFATAGPDMLGVQLFGFSAVIAGIWIASRLRSFAYVCLSVLGLAGQAWAACPLTTHSSHQTSSR